MSAEQQIALWAAAAMFPLLLNGLTRRGADALGLSVMLLMTWSLGRITGALYTPPENMGLYPLVDMISGGICFTAWRTRPAWWKMALVVLFLGQCTLHAAYWLNYWENGPRAASLYLYVLLNNVLFLGELGAVCVPGGGHVLVGLLARLSPRAGAVRHARARRG